MRTRTNIDFSIVIPTRERPELLFNCIHSIYYQATNKEKIETILILDYNDPKLLRTLHYLYRYPFRQYIRCILKEDSNYVIKDCHNAGSQLSTGKYIWIFNDDVEINTNAFDEILLKEINKFLINKRDRILYTFINDDIHTNLKNNGVFEAGSCFPIISRELLDCLNFLMPDKIEAWGADTALWQIVKEVKEPRYLDLTEKVKLRSYTVHNGSLTNYDNTQSHMRISSKCTKLSEIEIKKYANKINNRIRQKNKNADQN